LADTGALLQKADEALVALQQSPEDDSLRVRFLTYLTEELHDGFIAPEDRERLVSTVSRIYPQCNVVRLERLFRLGEYDSAPIEHEEDRGIKVEPGLCLNERQRHAGVLREVMQLPHDDMNPIVFVAGTLQETLRNLLYEPGDDTENSRRRGFLGWVKSLRYGHGNQMQTSGPVPFHAIAEGEGTGLWPLELMLALAYPNRRILCELGTLRDDWRKTVEAGHLVTIGASDSNRVRAEILDRHLERATDGVLSMQLQKLDNLGGFPNIGKGLREWFQDCSGRIREWFAKSSNRAKAKSNGMPRFIVVRNEENRNCLFDTFEGKVRGEGTDDVENGRSFPFALVEGRYPHWTGNGRLTFSVAGVNTYGTASGAYYLSDPRLMERFLKEHPCKEPEEPFSFPVASETGLQRLHPIWLRITEADKYA